MTYGTLAYAHNVSFPNTKANGVHVMRMCQAFGEIGWNVTLCSPSHSDTSLDESVFSHYGIKAPSFTVATKKLTAKRAKTWLNGWSLASLAASKKPDLVYTRSFHIAASAMLKGYKVALEVHEGPNFSMASYRLLQRWTLKRKRLLKLVSITPALAEDFFELVLPEKSFVAPDGAVIPPETSPASLPESKPGQLKVGYIGQLYPGKGMETIAPLSKLAPWADFHIIGGPPDRIEHWKQELNESDNVVFHGYVPHADTEAFRQACDILIMPMSSVTLSDSGKNIVRWTSPLKLFEYMASQKPIIASDLECSREALRNNENALLCEADNIDSWVAALAQLREDPHLRHKLAQQAFLDFEANYTWNRRAENISDQLVQALR